MTNMIEALNSSAEHWVAWMAGVSIDAAVLLAFVSLVWLALRRRVGPQVGCWLFLLVPLKLLMPLGVAAPAALAQWRPATMVAAWLDRAEASAPRALQDHGAQPLPTAEAKFAVQTVDHRIVRERTGELSADDNVARPTPAAATPAGMQAAATSPVTPRRTGPRLSLAAIAMLLWLAGVAVLAVRLLRSQVRFRAGLQAISLVNSARDEAPGSTAIEKPFDLSDLSRRAGVTQPVRVVKCDGLATPAVWGIWRPTIILPHAITTTLSPAQLEWVLLHELAHIRRRDLLLVTLQRLAEIVHFFNPLVWLANRAADRLREFACDDAALAQGSAEAVDSGEAFVRILQYAHRCPRNMVGALGMIGFDPRAMSFLRVQRLLDDERPIRTRVGPLAWVALLALAAISLPNVRAASGAAQAENPAATKDSTTKPPATKAAASNQVAASQPTGSESAKAGQTFDLRVVGPDGKPVPEAVVELRIEPAPGAEQIRVGSFRKKGTWWARVTTDVDGRLLVDLPGAAKKLDVDIMTPGYGPYWAGWSSYHHPESIPAQFTAELDAGWSIGGVVVDEDGKPVEGVGIRVGIDFKKRPGDKGQLGIGTIIKTDAQGKWRFDSVPASLDAVWVEIGHSAFKPNRRSLPRAEFAIAAGKEPAATITLDRGLTVTGKITDEEGRPIADALVRTKFANDIREARSGEDGTYRLGGCEPTTVRIVASAKGKAVELQERRIDPEMEPLNFTLLPGRTVRIRVLDDQGKPAPKARIFFQRWRGWRFEYFEFDHVNQYADENGVWVWNEAPVDEFQADICPPNGMSLWKQPLVGRDEEYVFRTPPALVVSGQVVDADTRQPLEGFQVMRGWTDRAEPPHWHRDEQFTASGGKYRLRIDEDRNTHYVRIEAKGYRAAVSREFKSNEGAITIDFALEKAGDIVGKVVTPNLQAADKASVVLAIPGSQIVIRNGEFQRHSTYGARVEADDAGRFQFAPPGTDFELIVLHASGYTQLKASPDWDGVRVIRLEPWASVEGTFRVGRKPIEKATLAIQILGRDQIFDRALPRIRWEHEVETGPNGQFQFERVLPGTGRIGRYITYMVDRGATEVTSASMVPAEFPAGQTTKLDLGGTGWAVVGKLQPPAGFTGQVPWSFARIHVGADDPEQRESLPYLRASVERDGTFQIDDIPTGKYMLSVRLDREPVSFHHSQLLNVGLGEVGDERLIDLGVLTLEKPAAVQEVIRD